jgi:hypothetical protein
MPKPKSSAPHTMTAADAHALADRLERNSREGQRHGDRRAADPRATARACRRRCHRGGGRMRHVAIIGARCRTDRETVDRLVDGLPPDTVIVSGGGAGLFA